MDKAFTVLKRKIDPKHVDNQDANADKSTAVKYQQGLIAIEYASVCNAQLADCIQHEMLEDTKRRRMESAASEVPEEMPEEADYPEPPEAPPSDEEEIDPWAADRMSEEEWHLNFIEIWQDDTWTTVKRHKGPYTSGEWIAPPVAPVDPWTEDINLRKTVVEEEQRVTRAQQASHAIPGQTESEKLAMANRL